MRNWLIVPALLPALLVAGIVHVSIVDTAHASASGDSLVGYWKFDEGSENTCPGGEDVCDSSGHSNHGTWNGSGGGDNTSPNWTTTKPSLNYTNSYSMDFDGTDDYVDSSFSIVNGIALSISLWFKLEGSAGTRYDMIMMPDITSTNGDQWGTQLTRQTSNTINFAVQDKSEGDHPVLATSSTYTDSAWHHLVATWNKNNIDSTDFAIYVDGVLDNGTFLASNYSAATVIDSSSIGIGANIRATTPNNNFDGQIDDVRIYNRALSPTEISALANGNHLTAIWDGSSSTNFNTAQNWDVSAVPDPFTHIIIRESGSGSPVLSSSISGASLTIESTASLDLSGHALEFTENGSLKGGGILKLKGNESIQHLSNLPSTSTGTVLYYGTGTYTGLAAGNSYHNLTINDGLVGYWKFDEGADNTCPTGEDVCDSSGYGNHGTINGGEGDEWTATTAPLNYANPYSMDFDGTDDYIEIGEPAVLDSIVNGSASLWFKASAFGSAKRMLSKDATGSNNDFVIWSHNDSKIYFTLEPSPSGVKSVSSAALSISQWYFALVTWGSQGMKMYINGSLVDSDPHTGNYDSSGNTWRIANRNGTNLVFDGLIDDLRIYNRALSPTEISTLANGYHPATASGTFTLNAALSIKNNLTLAGGNLDVSASNYAITTSGSWLNYGGVFTPRSGTVTLEDAAGSNTIASGGQPFANLTINGGATYTLADSLDVNGLLSLSAGTLDVSTHNFSIHAHTVNHTAGTFTARSGTLTLDGSSNASPVFSSALHNLTIEDPTEEGLVGYWKLDECQGITAYDVSGSGNNGTLQNGPIWTGSNLPNLSYDNTCALEFDGTDDYVISSTNNLSSTAGSIVVWTNPSVDSPSAQEQIVMGSRDNSRIYLLRLATSGNLGLRLGTSANQDSGTNLPADTWSHAVMIWNNGVYNLYLNGAEIDNGSYTGLSGTSSVPTIGAYSSDAVGTITNGYFTGLLDDIRIYNRALSPSEVANLANGQYADGANGTATYTLSANLDVSTLTLVSGILSPGSTTLTVSSDWNNLSTTGSFLPGTSTVTLDGSSSQTLRGSTFFHTLTASSTPRTLSFGSGTTQTITNALTLSGLTLAPLTASTTWNLNVHSGATHSLSHLTVSHSNASLGSILSCLTCTDGGNNTNWQFTTPTLSFQSGSLTLAETSGSASLVLLLSGSSLFDITIPFAIAGTATSSDFTLLTPSPLILNPGETSTGILLQFLNDADVEADETVILTLGTPTNASLGSTGTLTLTLTSDDLPPPSSSSSQSTTNSNSGGGGGRRGSTQYTASRITQAHQTILARFDIKKTEERDIIDEDNRIQAIARRKEQERLRLQELARQEELLQQAAAAREARIAARIEQHQSSIARLLKEQQDLQAQYAQRREERLRLALEQRTQEIKEQQLALKQQQQALEAERTRNAEEREQRIAQRRLEEARRLAQQPEETPTTSDTSVPSAPSETSIQTIAARRNRLFAVVQEQPVIYADVPTDAWFAPYVSYVVEENIAQGYKDPQGKPTGEFGIANPVTRAELLKMAIEASGQPLHPGTPRNPSARGSWAEAYVAHAEHLQLSVFPPATDVHAPATRGEVIQTILEVMGIPTGIKLPSPFGDVSEDHPYVQAITTAAAYGLVEGDSAPDGTMLNRFRPDDPINRAEVAKIVALVKEVTKR